MMFNVIVSIGVGMSGDMPVPFSENVRSEPS